MRKKIIIILLMSLTMLLLISLVTSICNCEYDGQVVCEGGDVVDCFCSTDPMEPCRNSDCVGSVVETCLYGCSEEDGAHCLPCEPRCTGKNCGPDNCGGTCPPDNCAASGQVCYQGNCCTPICDVGQECGSNHCGSICPGCNYAGGEVCDYSTEKCCTPDCSAGIECQDDGCGGTCNIPCVNPNAACNPATNKCDILVECNPACAENICGDNNGCGYPCQCSEGGPMPEMCNAGYCVPNAGGDPACTCGGDADCGGGECIRRLGDCTPNKDAGNGMCRGCEYWKGEGCGGDNGCNPHYCNLNYICTDGHCCEQGETWDTSTGRCVKFVCYLPGGIPPDVSQCCQNGDVGYNQYLSSGHCCPVGDSWNATTQRCETPPGCEIVEATLPTCACQGDCLPQPWNPTGYCYGVHVLTPCLAGYGTVCEREGGLYTCSHPLADLGARCPARELVSGCHCVSTTPACFQGMPATAREQCEACDPNWHIDNCHCCPKDYGWSVTVEGCVEHDPCFSASSNPLFCNYHAPDSPLFSFLAPWLSTNPQCIDFGESPVQACCFLGENLFGWNEGEEFYYWHETESITTY